jgi:predicted PhzF superfamily epimerase YddE/YHI9
VCLLQEPLTDEVMAPIAREMNLSETAFVLWEGDAWRLRWFAGILAKGPEEEV